MTSLNLQRPVNKHSTPNNFNDNMLSQSYPMMPSPLKMHTVHIENRPNPERVDISLPPSPTPTPNETPLTQSSQSDQEPLQKVTMEEQPSESRAQQSPPAIPPKSPHRGAKKTNWLSRLLSRLSCLHSGSRKKFGSKKDTKQPKDRKVRDRSTYTRGSGDGGSYVDPGPMMSAGFAASSHGGGTGIGGSSRDCGGDSGDCGGGCDC
ncbi:unnamed protein product [Aureobasidium uvarum]|uniref:Uncharacterized protein n=1 Tax=Aureobasidium uvarum TaxID=2773716 RepID=A0A9N8KRP6_9PEZI|nr:unnamed protein product [Aureobasidium uvarum]